MKAHRHSRGITLLGFLILLCVAGFFAYCVMKLVPVYVEYFGVVKAMEQIKDEPGAAEKTLEQSRRDLNVQFDLQYVDEKDIPPSSIQLKREATGPVLRIAYEKRVPFMYNIDLVASFDKSVNLTNAGAD
jgi:hypothetical protein